MQDFLMFVSVPSGPFHISSAPRSIQGYWTNRMSYLPTSLHCRIPNCHSIATRDPYFGCDIGRLRGLFGTPRFEKPIQCGVYQDDKDAIHMISIRFPAPFLSTVIIYLPLLSSVSFSCLSFKTSKRTYATLPIIEFTKPILIVDNTTCQHGLQDESPAL